MSTVKISTPDGGVPPVPNPVEGVHYTVEVGTPVEGDLVRLRIGTSESFFRKGPEITQSEPINTAAGAAEYRASVRRKAAKLSRAGDHAQANYLLSKLGA